MAEYLSPGVYVEEFDSGAKPMEGVGTSTAGFIGLASKGPVLGAPQLVTNFADFKRIYGGYLPEKEFGNYRFLAYAVEHFFINGGSRCFITRVAPADAKQSTGCLPTAEQPEVRFIAKNPGRWGDRLSVRVRESSKAKTQILEILGAGAEKKYRVKNGAGFLENDIVAFTCSGSSEIFYNRVVSNQDQVITFVRDFPGDVVDTALLPEKLISTCEVDLEVNYEDQSELYENVSFNIAAPNYIEKKLAKSDLIIAEYVSAEERAAWSANTGALSAGSEKSDIRSPFDVLTNNRTVSPLLALTGGSNGSIDSISASDFIGTDNGAGRRTGIQAFLDNDAAAVMAIPGVTDPNVQLALSAHCENLGSRFAVLDVPRDAKKVQEVGAHRAMFDTSYAALYHPWLLVFDPLDKKNIAIPPSGSVAGIYARSDISRGVHKAPANEVVRSCVGLDCQFNRGEQDILNPKGVNLIRAFPGQGIRVWGARTATSDGSWKYVNVRRLFIFIEESIKANTNWVIFEPNDEVLWVRVQRTISSFLTNLWRNGYLAGSSADEAFFVNIGRSTMSQDDIDNGRLICVIGVAPVKPAEFVIFRITQKTNETAQ